MNPALDAALAYAARGWPVFPCKPGAKTPATPHGVLDATTDPQQIRSWWAARPDANIGIATGAPGPDVLDVDIKPDGTGFTAFAELEQAGLLDGHQAMVKTPSGGLHVYFTGTTQRNARIPRRFLDLRATGGYVIAPPGTSAGRPYQMLTHDGGSGALDWQAARVLLDPPPAFTQPHTDPTTAPPAGTVRPGDDWATQTTWAQILTPHGWRKIRDLGGGRACWCRPGKPGPFTSATTRDDGGLYVFSTSTTFEPEVPYTKFGAYAVLEHGGDHTAAAAQLRRDGFGTPEPVITFTPPTQPPDTPGGGGQDWWSGIAARHTPIDWQQLFDNTPSEEDWIAKPLLAAGRSVALYSPPKAGKSLLALEIAAAAAAGRQVLVQPAGGPRKVLYVDLENSRRDIRDRLVSLGYKPADLANLVYLSFPSLPALDSPQGGREIMALTLAHQAEAVVIDTVSRVIAGKENDADTFAALYRYAMAPLKGLGIAVLRLDHAGKDVGKGQRGSSAKNADVDAVWTLNAAGPVITLQCEMSRTELDTQALSLRREKDPLRHEVTTQATGAAGKVQELMAKLDELGVPRDYGRDRCRKALNLARVKVDTNALSEAVSTRRRQPNLTDDLEAAQSGLHETAGQTRLGPRSQVPSANGAGNLTDDLRSRQSGTSKTAGQTRLQDHQSGAVRFAAGRPAKPDCTGVPIGGAPEQAGLGAPTDDHEPLCDRCGEHHHRYGPTGRPCFHQPAVTP